MSSLLRNMAQLLVMAGAATLACTNPASQPAALTADAGGVSSTPASEVTYVFRYGDFAADKDLLAAGINSLKAKLSGVPLNGRLINLDNSISMGYGVYGAADPWSSGAYGRYLIVVPLQPNVRVRSYVGPVKPTNIQLAQLAAIRSTEPMVTYTFGGRSMLVDPADSSKLFSDAVVIRDEKAILWDQISVFDLKSMDGAALDQFAKPKDFAHALSMVSRLGSNFIAAMDKEWSLRRQGWQPIGTSPAQVMRLAICAFPDVLTGRDVNGLLMNRLAPLLAAARALAAGDGAEAVEEEEVASAKAYELLPPTANPSTLQELGDEIQEHLLASRGALWTQLGYVLESFDYSMQFATDHGMTSWGAKAGADGASTVLGKRTRSDDDASSAADASVEGDRATSRQQMSRPAASAGR